MVHHKKLIEYRIATSIRLSIIKEKIDALRLVEDIDYHLLDIQQPVPQGGYSTKKVYMLTPEAFKKCLLRSQRRLGQAVDPVIYSDYYLLLKTVFELYSDYENILLVKQLVHQDHQLVQKVS